MLRKDGSRFIGEVYGSMVTDASGNAKAIIAITRDITERNTAEKALQESEEMYKLLVKTSPDAVTVIDLKGNIIELSTRTLELHGFNTVDEMLGLNAFDYIAPEDRGKAINIFHKVLEKGIIRNLECNCLRKVGTRFIGEINGSLVKDADGKPKAMIGITRDITERKRMEQALQRS